MTSNRLTSIGFSKNKGLVGACSWSVSRAHKSWSWSLLLMDFHLSRAKIIPTYSLICSGVVNDLKLRSQRRLIPLSNRSPAVLRIPLYNIHINFRHSIVEPLYIERPRDLQNMLVITRFRYIEVLFHIFHYYWGGQYCSFIPRTSLYIGSLHIKIPLGIRWNMTGISVWGLYCPIQTTKYQF